METEVPPKPRKLITTVRILLGSAILGLFLCFVVAGISSSGVPSMAMTHWFFIAATALAIFAVVTSEIILNMRSSVIVLTGLAAFFVVGGGLYVLDRWLGYQRQQLDALLTPPTPKPPPSPIIGKEKPPKASAPPNVTGNSNVVMPNSKVSQTSKGKNSPNVVGSGNVIGSGNTILNLGPENATGEQRKQIRVALGQFMMQGITLRNRCRSDDLQPSLESDAQKWFDDVQRWLTNNLDSSFNAQFVAEKITVFSPGGVPQQRVSLWLGLNQRIETLDKFIDEFK